MYFEKQKLKNDLVYLGGKNKTTRNEKTKKPKNSNTYNKEPKFKTQWMGETADQIQLEEIFTELEIRSEDFSEYCTKRQRDEKYEREPKRLGGYTKTFYLV